MPPKAKLEDSLYEEPNNDTLRLCTIILLIYDLMNLQHEDFFMFQIVGDFQLLRHPQFLVFPLFALNDYSKSTEKIRN